MFEECQEEAAEGGEELDEDGSMSAAEDDGAYKSAGGEHNHCVDRELQ